jgi:thiol-disulfide isomerase/thioredoxin
MTRRSVSALLLFGFLAAGCRPSQPPADSPVSPETAAPLAPSAQVPSAGPDAAEVTVDIKSWAEVQELIAAQRGKVVVVDIWSTYCVPCTREFPNLVALQREHGPQVACISVDVDYFGDAKEPPESFRDKVLDFLQKQQAHLTNVICSDPDEHVFQTLRTSSVPIVLVYDRQGRLHRQFAAEDAPSGSEGFSYAEHITPLVKQLLAESPTTPTEGPPAE